MGERIRMRISWFFGWFVKIHFSDPIIGHGNSWARRVFSTLCFRTYATPVITFDFLWRGESTTLNVLTQDDWFSSATKLIIKVEDIILRKCEILSL